MHGSRIGYIEDPGPYRTSAGVRYALLGVGVIGLLAFLVGAFTGDAESRQQVWAGYMVTYLFFWFLALGGAAFLAIQYTAGAKWFIAMKRLPEAVGSFLYRGGFVLPLLSLLGSAYLYNWVNSSNYEEIWGAAEPTYPTAGTLKAFWMSGGMHAMRVIVYTALLTGLGYWVVKASRDRSSGAASATSARRKKASIIFLIFFGYVFTFYAWEAVMSVEVKWYSTMWGVYIFAGMFQAVYALLMLGEFLVHKRTNLMTGRQLYDTGTYVMAFSCFMAYIGFSQFMLIWYANIPEETFFYLDRYQGGWWVVTVALPFLKFFLPFLVLMPPSWRTSVVAQSICCVGILAGQVLDLYWVVYPTYYSSLQLPSFINVLTFLGMAGFFGYAVLSELGAHSMMPVEDAELLSSVNGDYLHA